MQSISLWQVLVDFWRLDHPNVVWVLWGSMLLGATAAVVGSFTFLRKRSLMGDALSHAALPGVMAAFLLFQTRDPLVMLLGAMASSFLGYFLIDFLTRHSKIKQDSALAIVLSSFFALGIFLLSLIQSIPLEGKSGLDKILFGQSAAMQAEDIQLLSMVALAVLAVILLAYHKLRLITLDKAYAKTLGVRTQYYELSLAIAIVVTVVIGLQMVGVVLMAAVLLIPIAAARYWSHQLSQLLWLSAFIGLLAGAVSTNISYSAPAMPSGPWMVLVLFVLFFISLIFAPQRGLLSKALRAHQQGLKVDQENVLRSFYVLAEREANPMSRFSPAAIYRVRNMRQSALMQALRVLTARGDLKAEAGQYWLSKQGLEQAKDLTRYHRLWEMYLATQANIDPDKVHGQAEQSEHVMTPELGERLAEELGHPTIDPHGKPIPTKGEGL